MRVGILGGGAMGEAIASALIRAGVATAAGISVSDVAVERRDHLAAIYGVSVTGENAEAAQGVDVVVLAVKPQEFSNVAAGLRGALEGATVLSIMAGVDTKRIARELGHEAVVRVMPNTPAFVGEAMSVWLASDAVSPEGRDAAARILRALGREVEVRDEKYLDMATAVSGSGPGFVFFFIEALIEGGVRVGLERAVATELAVQTLLGSGKLAHELGKTPAELREMVTSRGGTTAAGLQALEDAGMREAVIGAVEAAFKRAKEL